MSIIAHQPLDAPDIEKTRWRLDPERSKVEFHTKTFWGLVTVHGRFERYHGTLDLRDDQAIALTIDASSLDTSSKLRDKHLRSGDFFDVVNHPRVRFESDSATIVGQRLNVRGRLYAAGHVMPLDLEAGLQPVGGEIEVHATVDADHHKLGMTHSTLGMIRTPSQLIVHGRLVRDPG